ncbi:hypothetical protein F511_06454 [Dorcoceras hygrometricum]|uniref:Uncharacterized protein n=1 Tax=Dorcoceras hygrometricum TaxID=472368 RepID=A0A2Z7B0Z6_9LAMI|nr:hypothetical protein F511_06454 [Dorcoceras hygrometricum]
MTKAAYRGSIRTSNQFKSQSDLTRARHQQPAQVCFLTNSRRSLTEAAVLTKLEWEESLTQKLKSERGKPSNGIREATQTCNYFAPLPQVDLQLQTDIARNS